MRAADIGDVAVRSDLVDGGGIADRLLERLTANLRSTKGPRLRGEPGPSVRDVVVVCLASCGRPDVRIAKRWAAEQRPRRWQRVFTGREGGSAVVLDLGTDLRVARIGPDREAVGGRCGGVDVVADPLLVDVVTGIGPAECRRREPM